MEISSLKKLCDETEAMGLDTVVLKMPVPKSWIKGGGTNARRVRSPFGLCRFSGGYRSNEIVIFPTIKQCRAYIEKAEQTKVFVILINEEANTASVEEMSYGLMEIMKEQNSPNAKIVRFFFTKKEAIVCMQWSLEQLAAKSDPAP